MQQLSCSYHTGNDKACSKILSVRLQTDRTAAQIPGEWQVPTALPQGSVNADLMLPDSKVSESYRTSLAWHITIYVMKTPHLGVPLLLQVLRAEHSFLPLLLRNQGEPVKPGLFL